MSKSLIQIEADALALEKLLIEQDGEVNATLEAWLLEVEKNLAEKADWYAVVMDRFEASADYFYAKASKLKDAAAQLENAKHRLRERVKEVMERNNWPEIRGSDVVFKLVRSQPKLLIDDKLGDKWFKVEQVVTPDKERIKASLADGEEIPGARLQESKALRITLNKGDK